MRSEPLRNHWRCPGCDYDLYGLAGEPFRCPECGCESSLAELFRFNSPRERNAGLAYVVSGIVGFAIWAALSLYSRGAEIWDNAIYWKAGLPALFLASAVLGYVWPQRPWRWSCGLVAVESLLIFMPGLVAGFAPLLPVSLCFAFGLCVLSTPFAYGGAALRTLRD